MPKGRGFHGEYLMNRYDMDAMTTGELLDLRREVEREQARRKRRALRDSENETMSTHAMARAREEAEHE